MAINVLLVDDHHIVRDGLKFILSQDASIGLIDEAKNGQQAILKATKTDFDIVVLDYEMPNFNGVFAARELIKLKPSIGILMLSLYHDKEHVFDAIQAGIKGYLSKETETSEVIEAIKCIANGGTWFKSDIAELVTPYLIAAATNKAVLRSTEILTCREKEIIKLVAVGARSSDIAEKLFISKRTVEVHRANILKKLKLKNASELIRYALRHKLVTI